RSVVSARVVVAMQGCGDTARRSFYSCMREPDGRSISEGSCRSSRRAAGRERNPVADDRQTRHAECFSRFLNSQAAEEPKLDDVALAPADRGQALQRLV